MSGADGGGGGAEQTAWTAPELALYIHYPYCVRKCPYCDFNSHALQREGQERREADYLAAVHREFAAFRPWLEGRRFVSVFFGGGTPSLAPDAFVGRVLELVAPHVSCDAEITAEANPGAADSGRFSSWRACGVNRLSLGVQSFDDLMLARLGRIHDRRAALEAVEHARRAGFANLSLDLMYGLPGQSARQALSDLSEAAACAPEHLSWYELTLEPGTPFALHPPPLPEEEVLEDMEQAGRELLRSRGFRHYEVSNYCRPGRHCVHSVNYWRYGDYLGLGAGAHSKLSAAGTVHRRAAPADPAAYVADWPSAALERVPAERLPGEYMLNRLRLFGPIELGDFTRRTALSTELIEGRLRRAAALGLVRLGRRRYCLTRAGRRHLNAVVRLFV